MNMVQKFNENGQIIYNRDNNGYEAWYDYDERGNEIHFRDSDGREIWKEYNSRNRLVRSVNSDGHETKYTNHAMHRTRVIIK